MNAIAEQLIQLHAAKAAQSPEKAALLSIHLKANTRVTDEGELVVVDQAGNPRITDHQFTPMTVEALIDETKSSMPALFAPLVQADVAKKEAAETLSLTQRMRLVKTARDQAAEAARKPDLDTSVNPFSPKSRNVTQQMIILRTDPVMAEKLKAAALAETK